MKKEIVSNKSGTSIIKEGINLLYIKNNNKDMHIGKEANTLSGSKIAIAIKGESSPLYMKNNNKDIYNNKESKYSQVQEYQ